VEQLRLPQFSEGVSHAPGASAVHRGDDVGRADRIRIVGHEKNERFLDEARIRFG
jgi:hypothetical protein